MIDARIDFFGVWVVNFIFNNPKSYLCHQKLHYGTIEEND